MSREAMQMALDALQYIYKETSLHEDELIDGAIAALRTALAEQPAPVLTDAEIHDIVRKAGRGSALRPMNAEPTSVRIARAVIAAAIPPGYCVVKDEPVAWIGLNPRNGVVEFGIDKPAPSVMRDFNMQPLYAAMPGEKLFRSNP